LEQVFLQREEGGEVFPEMAFFFPFSFIQVTFFHLASISDLQILLSRPR